MSRPQALLLLLGTPLVLLLVGYPLVRRVELGGIARLGLAILTGLAALLLSVSVLNAMLPMAGGWAWGCVVPWILPLTRRDTRAALIADIAAAARSRTFALAAILALGFLAFLLWPVVSRPGLVFYDGSANHDAFFWIANAEHLRRSSYLVPPIVDASHPFYYSATAIIGVIPAWGRMGAEGLLALASALTGHSPLQIYVVASAALFFPWLAAQYLLLETFVAPRLSPPVIWLVAALQPVFVAFHALASAPNLVGVLMGALVLLAVARVSSNRERTPWWFVLVLAVHGLLVSYPEMIPAVALSVLILVVRAARLQGYRATTSTAFALLAGGLINPLTTIRSWNGFFVSLGVVRPDDIHSNILAAVPGSAALPAFATLSVPFGHLLSQPLLAGLVVAVLISAMVIAFMGARDRIGLAAIVAGVGLMVGFTLLTHFGYGWQKAAQFSGLGIATLLPGAALAGWVRIPAPRSTWRSTVMVLGSATGVVFAAATLANVFEAHKWSTRKFITRDWYDARAYSETALRNVPVLIDAHDFQWPYFYTMWSAYFLPDNPLVFVGDNSGGYIRGDAERHRIARISSPRAKLVTLPLAAPAPPHTRWRHGELAIVELDRAMPAVAKAFDVSIK